MAAFANMQQANAEKARQLTQLRNQVSDLEHTARRREEELNSAQKDLRLKTRQITDAAGDVGRLEVKEVRQMYQEMEDSLRCPVNPSRWKNCIISKCFHMFNAESLYENLAKRNRKCPTCNSKYDKDNIVKVPLYDPM
jgi:E3 ubiquitin-protein ligase BRE1